MPRSKRTFLIGLPLDKRMHRLSFKVKHKNCYETAFSVKFPLQHITVIDIQSPHPREKQYLYYITGNTKQFDSMITYLRKSKGYKLVKEIERSQTTLLLLVVLHQTGYIQNVIQKYHGFLIDLHTVSGGYEYWHIGVINRNSISKMVKTFEKMGEFKILFIGEVEFAHALLSKQQKKVLTHAYENGYYELPRKTTIKEIARLTKLSHATVGEHLIKAENKILKSAIKKVL